jgi:hypothetical protein
MKLMSRKRTLYVGTAIAVFLIVGFFFDIHSEPFQYATQWAKQSSDVRQVVGEVVDVSSFPKSWSYRYNSTEGFAQYRFTVSGTKGEAKMYVKLQKTLGKWHVVEATLNGSALSKLE